MIDVPMLARRTALGTLLGLGLLSTACSGGGAAEDSTGDVVSELRSDMPRIMVDLSHAAGAGVSEQRFAVSFLQAQDAAQNLTFSPHSLSTAFAMLSGAAEGQTLKDIEDVLEFGKVDEAFHRSQDALELSLEARNRDAIAAPEQQVEAQILRESNDIWVRADVPPLPSYLDTLAQFYGVGVHQADFGQRPEEARQAINSKVSDDTHALIPELIPGGVIDSDTVSVLTNALYFKAPWAAAFDEPKPGDFHTLDGATTSVSLMRSRSTRTYYEGEGFVSVAVPYYGGDLEMLLIVPDAGQFDRVRGALTSDTLTQVVSDRASEFVDLTLPKFNLKSTVPAKQVLASLGMVAPFDRAAAQLPGFPPGPYYNIYVSDVLHQATVAVDDKGTEASAATAIVVAGTTSAAVDPPEPKVVTVDRPFLFVIRDNPTGSTLFIGQVVAP